MNKVFEFKSLQKKADYLAPDTSEIRLLPTFDSGGLCHCTLPENGISKAVRHQTIVEIWYCLSGKGIIWQKNDEGSAESEFTSGDSFTIPVGNTFQFRNNGNEPLYILIATMPEWPGENEAIPADGKWYV